MLNTPPTGASDLERLRAGDERTFIDLVGRHHDTMVRVARSFVPSYAVAQEVVQDTWLAVLRGMDGFEEHSSFRTWLYTILVNRGTEFGRNHRSVVTSDRQALEMRKECRSFHLGDDHVPRRSPGHY